MEQKNYTLKECRAFNQKQLEITTAFARGNFANAECKNLFCRMRLTRGLYYTL